MPPWQQAKVFGLKEAWEEMHSDKTYRQVTWIAERVYVQGHPKRHPHHEAVRHRSNEHVRCLTGHNMQPTSLLPLIKGFKTRLRSRQNRIADILKLVSDPAPFSPHLLLISRLLLKNNTRIPSDPSRIPSDFLTPLPRVLLIFRYSTEVGSRRIPSRIPSILQHLLSQMRILVWRTYSYYNSN